jgi:hypothetical protein
MTFTISQLQVTKYRYKAIKTFKLNLSAQNARPLLNDEEYWPLFVEKVSDN